MQPRCSDIFLDCVRKHARRHQCMLPGVIKLRPLTIAVFSHLVALKACQGAILFQPVLRPIDEQVAAPLGLADAYPVRGACFDEIGDGHQCSGSPLPGRVIVGATTLMSTEPMHMLTSAPAVTCCWCWAYTALPATRVISMPRMGMGYDAIALEINSATAPYCCIKTNWKPDMLRTRVRMPILLHR